PQGVDAAVMSVQLQLELPALHPAEALGWVEVERCERLAQVGQRGAVALALEDQIEVVGTDTSVDVKRLEERHKAGDDVGSRLFERLDVRFYALAGPAIPNNQSVTA